MAAEPKKVRGELSVGSTDSVDSIDTSISNMDSVRVENDWEFRNLFVVETINTVSGWAGACNRLDDVNSIFAPLELYGHIFLEQPSRRFRESGRLCSFP